MTLAKKQAAKKCSTSVGAHPNRRQLSPAETKPSWMIWRSICLKP
ncbi:hypothetical protein SPWS13_0043 [Shewanella putrefaciens]|nr:hypothetical protein SPWS13_0043 [Shewanella putrefaciens]